MITKPKGNFGFFTIADCGVAGGDIGDKFLYGTLALTRKGPSEFYRTETINANGDFIERAIVTDSPQLHSLL
jgi:hypothetical protein